MNQTITYHVTREMQKRSTRSYFWKHIVGRRWLIVPFYILVAAVSLQPAFTPVGHYLAVGVMMVGVVIIVAYIRAYGQHMQTGRDLFNMYDTTDVTVTLADDTLTITMAQAQRQTGWDRVTRVLDTKEFLFLFSKKVSLGSLPKSEFSSEQLEFIRKMTERGQAKPSTATH